MYSLQLLRNFYAEGLVDNRTFLAWLIHQLYISNLAQLGFIARLVDEFMEGIVSTRALTRPTVEACLNRLSEVCFTLQELTDPTHEYVDQSDTSSGSPC